MYAPSGIITPRSGLPGGRSTAALAGLVAATSLLATCGNAFGQDEIHVTGVIRDFQASHADFAVVPSGGVGHYANNVDLSISPDNRPAFTGNGFKVTTQWRQKDDHPIPPHFYYATRTVKLANAPSIDSGATVDTWDSSLGPYGGSNVGPAPAMSVGEPMPEITAPAMGPSVGDVYLNGNTTSVLTADLHCDTLTIKDGYTLQVNGKRTVVCEGDFIMGDLARIHMLADSTLDLYVLGKIRIKDSAVNANTYEYQRITIYLLSNQSIHLGDSAEVYATLIAPNGTLHMADASDVYGQVTASGLTIENNSGLHIDGIAHDDCGEVLADVLGEAGVASTGAITSSSTFDQWYQDTMGANLSAPHTITLTKNSSGVFEYLDDSFYPIDGLLYGNESGSHNPNFTFTFTVRFTYQACNDGFFEFRGNDDAWMFIDDDLALDLGGIAPGARQYIEMERLGLTDGQTYTIRFFYAHRSGSTPMFRLRTNLPLETTTATHTVSAGFD